MNSKKLSLVLNIVKFVLVGVGVIAFTMTVTGPNTEADKDVQVAFVEGGPLAMAIGYTLLIICLGVAAILFFFGVQLVTNTKKTVISIVGILAALVLFLIFWMIGTGDTQETLALRMQVEDSTIQSTSAGLWTAMIGVAIAALVWILSPLMGRMRK